MKKQLEMGHLDITSLEKCFAMELKLNKDLITAPPKPNIKNSVTHYIDPKPNMLGVIHSTPLDDGINIYDFSLE